MEMISFCYKRIFFLKVAKFRYLLTIFLVQNDFPFGTRENGSNVYFFFCDSLSKTRVVMWLRHRFPNPKVESSIPGDLLNLFRATFFLWVFFTSLTYYQVYVLHKW